VNIIESHFHREELLAQRIRYESGIWSLVGSGYGHHQRAKDGALRSIA
jgi:hypothetical protein